jgi:hypothetical protein
MGCVPVVNPSKIPFEGKQALADVVVSLRDQAGCSSWGEFSELLLKEAGLEVPDHKFERIGPSPQYATRPDPGALYAVAAWAQESGRTFANGDPITLEALWQVALCQRIPSGALIEQPNR